MRGRSVDIDGKPVGFHITARGNLVVENTLENSIHDGRRFHLINYDDTLQINDTVNFLFVPAEGYSLHLDSVFTSDVECSIEVLFHPTIGDYGTELMLRNHNQNYVTSQMNSKIYKDVTDINDDGISTIRSKIQAGKNTSASRYDTGEFVLAYPYRTMVIITLDEGPGYLVWEFGISEVANY